MSTSFRDTTFATFVHEVNVYARKPGHIRKGEEVPFTATDGEYGLFLNFPQPLRPGSLGLSVVITETPDEILFPDHLLFPCGAKLLPLIKTTAKAVVHAVFDPADA